MRGKRKKGALEEFLKVVDEGERELRGGMVELVGEEGGLERDWLGLKSVVLSRPPELVAAERLFSDTTLRDFSKTFHSLIVLSAQYTILQIEHNWIW